MPDLDSHLDQIVDASHDLLDPDEAERVEALAARLLAEQRARGSVPASAPAAVRRDRTRRLRWTGAGAALAGAAAVVLVIAFGPGDAGSSRAHLPAPDTAEAALRSAAASAGKESWQPLGTNDYFHVTTTSYVPDIPESDLGPSDRESMFLAQLYVNESWFGRDGRGKAVSLVGGSGDPSRVPSMYRDPKTGKVLSTGGTRRSDGKPPEVAAVMAHPDTVRVMAWPRSDQSAYQRAWVRTRTGFLKTVDIAMSEQAMGAPQDAAATLGQYWGATTAIVEEANANADPDAAAKALVDSFLTDPDPDRDRLATMRMDDRVKVTPAEADREAGIEHAVNLLGSAPLSPNVRKALYRWLAKQPGASVRHGVVDEVGRHGDEVTFEHIRDVPVPTFRVTARELIGEFAGKGLPKYDLSKIDLDKVYVVDDLRQTRRWRVSFILDLESGALLQRYMYLQQREVGDQPRFITWATGPRVDVGDFGGGSGSALAQVFLSRERTSSIEPTLAVCKPHPEVCR